jgi:hypothetical protein
MNYYIVPKSSIKALNEYENKFRIIYEKVKDLYLEYNEMCYNMNEKYKIKHGFKKIFPNFDQYDEFFHKQLSNGLCFCKEESNCVDINISVENISSELEELGLKMSNCVIVSEKWNLDGKGLFQNLEDFRKYVSEKFNQDI